MKTFDLSKGLKRIKARHRHIILTTPMKSQSWAVLIMMMVGASALAAPEREVANGTLLLAFQRYFQEEAQRAHQSDYWFINVTTENKSRPRYLDSDLLTTLQTQFPKVQPARNAVISSRMKGVYDRESMKPGLLFDARFIKIENETIVIELARTDDQGTDCHQVTLTTGLEGWELTDFKLLWSACKG